MGEEFTPREITGTDVVAEAKLWVGTPYKVAGSTLQGCCCAGLPFGVGKALGQIPLDAKLPAHNPLTPNPRVLISTVRLFGREVSRDEARPGDVAVLKFEERPLPRHLGIITDSGLIQLFPALSIPGVRAHSWDDYWRSLVLAVYRYKGIVDVKGGTD